MINPLRALDEKCHRSSPPATRASWRRGAAGIVAGCGCLVALAGCGSSAGGGSHTSSDPSVMIGQVSGYGSVLKTPAGQPLYLHSTDPSGSSSCTGACSSTWKPLTVSGSPGAGSGVDSSLLSSFTRSGGGTQVLYNKHALYTHTGSAGSVAGTSSYGGVWYLVNAKGSAVTTTTTGGY